MRMRVVRRRQMRSSPYGIGVSSNGISGGLTSPAASGADKAPHSNRILDSSHCAPKGCDGERIDVEASGDSGSIPEDAALAILLHSVASPIDPTGQLYLKLCSSFHLSGASANPTEALYTLSAFEGDDLPSLGRFSSRVDEIVSPSSASPLSTPASSNGEERPCSSASESNSSSSEADGSLKWGVDMHDSVSDIQLPEQLCDVSLSELLTHLKATGLSDLVKRIQERVLATIPTALTTPRFRPIKWKLGRVLGKGAFGECRMALCEDTGALFAVKAVALGGPPSSVAQTVNSVQRELEVLRGVSHPHIVDMFAVSCTAATSTPAALCDTGVSGAGSDHSGSVGIVSDDGGSHGVAVDQDHSGAKTGNAAFVGQAGKLPVGGGGAPGGGGGLVLNIAMEYMEGGSLAKMIEDFGPLPEPVVASYARCAFLCLTESDSWTRRATRCSLVMKTLDVLLPRTRILTSLCTHTHQANGIGAGVLARVGGGACRYQACQLPLG